MPGRSMGPWRFQSAIRASALRRRTSPRSSRSFVRWARIIRTKLRERDWVNLGQEMCRATGTVDKFQGQQAPIVFFSIATSSDQDPPRNLAFLFSRNCLNMAISRAQCLAYLVCSPRLLEARCPSIEEMELVNALCRFAHQRVKTAAGLCQ